MISNNVTKASVLLSAILLAFFGWALWNKLDSPKALSALPVQVTEVPGTDSDVKAQIPTMDVAVDANESLHIVWRSLLNNNDQPAVNRDSIFYIRGDLAGARWSKPIVVADNKLGDNRMRILVGPDNSLHLLFGTNLRHLVSLNNGQSWQELAPLIHKRGRRASVFDAIFVGKNLVIAYLDHPEAPYEEISAQERGLYVIRWSAVSSSEEAKVASFPNSLSGPPTPRLIAEGSRLHLVFGLNADRVETEKGGSIKGQLFYLRSEDGGSTWSAPLELAANGEQGRPPEKVTTQSIQGIELLATRQRLYAFYRASTLFMISTADGLNWSPAVEIAPAGLRGTVPDNSLSASIVSGSDDGWLAWIDTRFRKSDRRWWNPLGGMPWSDDPDWVNNDILGIRISEIPGSSKGAAKEQPSDPASRLTEPLSFADSIRLLGSDKRVFLLWAGRRKVGKRVDTFDEASRLFFTTLPLH